MHAATMRPALRASLPFAPLRARASAAAGSRQQRRSLSIRAAADTDSSPLPVALAVGAPIASVALASAFLNSGTLSADAINAYFHFTAGVVFDANAAGQARALHCFGIAGCDLL
jgi:hypothetical protein